MKTLLVLTQYKRSHLEKQLQSINNQTLKPDIVVVFQNENHIDISPLKKKYNFIHIKSDYNTKYFGRFSICFSFPVDICIVMDDDIIPGKNCLKNYIDQHLKTNAIIGGNGRIGNFNKNINNNKLIKRPPDVGYRPENVLVDFVGHLWCFKKDWLYYMFAIKPYSYETGEDMHLCFSSKVLGNIQSYCCQQVNKEDICDITMNKLAIDDFSSYKITNKTDLRSKIEEHFIEKYSLKLINNNI